MLVHTCAQEVRVRTRPLTSVSAPIRCGGGGGKEGGGAGAGIDLRGSRAPTATCVCIAQYKVSSGNRFLGSVATIQSRGQ
eukprot:5259343-Pleurochrysis_carterae.AAC.3